ncbi:FAD-dependent oxidoreductase [Simiduia curdlanivorans]|uniref:Flavin monoamine oxidase family protein n=1 Tax=Simiduia curdlanivorans TaxID=1492769 RepID=A0ABV8V190_9GAMM|nr:FAD-dependent oxidoreductase [Simiduia curdlanivorans]MDN3637847.1 FAD-dependent oxidoreductase [Simiduia curdlanivorans]
MSKPFDSPQPLCHYDVVIVGAGFSGLYAARILARKYSILLLEASEQVGGRVRNHQFANGDVVDIGGQWLGPGQDRMYKLAGEAKRSIFPLYNRGDNLFLLGTKKTRYQGTIPKIGPVALADLGQLLARFEGMARQIDPQRPWAHPKAQRWDSQTLHSWVQRNSLTKTARQVFNIGIGAVFAGEARDMSLLHALFYASSGESMEHLLSVTGGAQQDRVHGGTWSICYEMAQQLGERCLLDAAVKKIDQHADGVSLCYEQNGVMACVSARKIIMAIPPNQINRISFNPPLPAWRDQLFQRMPSGSCIKYVARYEHAFWRDEQLSGQVASTNGPVHVVFDNGEKGKDAGLLMGFVDGDTARAWSAKSAQWRQEQVLACFVRFFGENAKNPAEFVEKNWSEEPYIRGCYAAHMTPGAWTGGGDKLRSPELNVHWAGTEMATEWYGYMEGALEAAERASAEVHSLLSRHLERTIK